jgi:hypothetical protein
VEATTGPLGQGIAMAVGMAMAEKHLAAIYNKPGFEVVNHHTYALLRRRRPDGRASRTRLRRWPGRWAWAS